MALDCPELKHVQDKASYCSPMSTIQTTAMSTHTPLTTAITLLPRIPATNSLAMTSNSAHLSHPLLGCCQTSPHHLLMHRALGIISWWDATALHRNLRSLLSPLLHSIVHLCRIAHQCQPFKQLPCRLTPLTTAITPLPLSQRPTC